jgi:hypothetical protein
VRWFLWVALVVGCNGPSAPPAARAPSDAGAADAHVTAEAGAPDAAAGVTAAARVLDPSVKWGHLPRVELTLTNHTAAPVGVVRPGADNDKLELARVVIAPAASPRRTTTSSWRGVGASGLVSIAPGAPSTFALSGAAAGAEEFLPGKYALSIIYQLADYQKDRMKEAHVSAPGAWEGYATTASVPFEITSDGSAALAARQAAYDGKNLSDVELTIAGCPARMKVGASCQLELAAKNRGGADVWLGPGWAIRTRGPKGEMVDGNGPRPSDPVRVRPKQRTTLGGWSMSEPAPGRYTFAVLYGSGSGAAKATSNDVVVDVVAK